MNLSNIKKPWFVPAWIWNKGLDLAAEKAKDEARVGKIAKTAGDKAADLMEKAVGGLDSAKVARTCANCQRAAELFGRLAAALEDGEMSAAERAEIAESLENVIRCFVEQDAIDAKIDEIAAALRA